MLSQFSAEYLGEQEQSTAYSLLSILDWNPAIGLSLIQKPSTMPKDCCLCDHPIVSKALPTHSHISSLYSLQGTVTRTFPVRLRERCTVYECADCGTMIESMSDDLQYNLCPKPAVCTGSKPDGARCYSAKFSKSRVNGHDDCQEIRVQECTGSSKRSISVVLLKTLVDRARPGDSVIVTGSVLIRWRPVKADSLIHTEMFILASSIQGLGGHPPGAGEMGLSSIYDDSRETELLTRDAIIESFCPQLHGLHAVKLAVLLTVIGGCTPPDDSDDGGGTTRSQGHLLLAGDPGTAKSKLLIAASRISKRAVMTTGQGTTSAGLTVTASRLAASEGGGWTLEPGALVLASGGICCIDEFGGLSEGDRRAIHEALEQQCLSIAKAGLVCRLKTRCSLIAACNPKDKFDVNESLSANLAIASPLLSRFDLIFILLDREDAARDSLLADAVLNNATKSASDILFNEDQLRSFVVKAKSVNPTKMSPLAHLMLSRYYQKQRQQDLREAARTTIRLLHGLIRLAQAHAKLMLRNCVLARDASVACWLIDMSLSVRGVLGHGQGLLEGRSDEPDKEIGEFISRIAGILGINLSAVSDDPDGKALECTESERLLSQS